MRLLPFSFCLLSSSFFIVSSYEKPYLCTRIKITLLYNNYLSKICFNTHINCFKKSRKIGMKFYEVIKVDFSG